MKCVLEFTGKMDGVRYVHKCRQCHREYRSSYADTRKIKARCSIATAAAWSTPEPPAFGSGSELTAIFRALDIRPSSKCGCDARAAQMDATGTAGCLENKAEILAWLKDAYDHAGYLEKIKAGAMAAVLGLPMTLEGLLDLAIDRARQKESWDPQRNLIYHVCPLEANDLWLKNVRQLKRRTGIFNGRKVIAVATGAGCHSLETVRLEFGDNTFEFMEIPNDRELREVASFLPLLETIASPSPEEVTFYGHTKGNGTAEDVRGARRWANAMYHYLLDDWPRIRRFLISSPMAGTHKMEWQENRSPYPSGLKHGLWMYSGTFYWFRHDRIFTHPLWRDIPVDRYGAESWPAGLFEAKQVLSVYQPWGPGERHPNPYKPELYSEQFDDVP